MGFVPGLRVGLPCKGVDERNERVRPARSVIAIVAVLSDIAISARFEIKN